MKVRKSNRLLCGVLALVVAFTMLFMDCGIANAEEKAEITGTFGEYYTYTLNQNTGVVTFDMKEEKNNPVLGWHETNFYYLYQDIKEIRLTENVKKSEDYSLELYLYRLWSAERIVVDNNNPDFASQDGVLFNKKKTILYAYPAMKNDAQYTIPDSVVQIGTEDIDKQGTGRRYCPFESAEKLKTVEIPATVTKIFYNSFSNQDDGGGNSIEKFVVDTGNTNYQSVDGVLFSKNGEDLVAYPTGNTSESYTVPDGVKNIYEDAFTGAMKLRQIVIPEGVETIGEGAFLDYLGSPKEITIPASVQSIGRGALAGDGYTIYFARETKLNEFPSTAFEWECDGTVVHVPCDMNWTLQDSYAERMTLIKDHDMGKWVVTEYPDDDGRGIITKKCAHCDYKINEEFVDEEGTHKWGEWKITKTATCTETGKEERKCVVCMSTEERDLSCKGHSFTNYTYNNDAAVGKDGTETAVCDNGCGATDTRTKAGTALSGGGSSGGGIYIPPVQKPEISSGDGYTTELSNDGKTAEIVVDEDYELVDVSVNGISKGNTTTLEGLKTGDKVVITVISKVEKIQNQLKTVTKENLQAHSKQVKLKNGKKAVKLTWKNTSGVDFDGVEIFRSFKRYEGFGTKPIFTTEKEQHYNTAVKKGTRYYYKVRGYIEYDGVKYYSGWSAKAWRTVK